MVLILNLGKGGWNERSINLDRVCGEISSSAELGQKELTDHGKSTGSVWRIMYHHMGTRPTEYEIMVMLNEFVNNITYLDPVRQPSPSSQASEDHSMDVSGSNLVRVLHTLLTSDPKKYVQLTDEILKILPSFEKMLSPLRGTDVTLSLHERDLKNAIDLENLSSGIKQILMLVVDIINAIENSLVIIEEPEIHLHARSQRHLFELINIESQRKQFLLTTHSPIFTAFDQGTSTYLVTKQQGQSRCRLVQEPDQLKLIKHELGHKNTDLFSYDCIVFIEGDSEDKAFPIIAEAMGYDLVRLGIKLMNVRGTGKAGKIEQYLEYLKDSGTMSYVISDGDNTVSRKIKDWIGAGLIGEKSFSMWEREFEDCFNSTLIIQAMTILAKGQGLSFKLSKEDLDIQRNQGKKVGKIIQKYLHDSNQPSLDKPTLAENMATIIAEQIHMTKEREQTEPEKSIKQIVDLVHTSS